MCPVVGHKCITADLYGECGRENLILSFSAM